MPLLQESFCTNMWTIDAGRLRCWWELEWCLWRFKLLLGVAGHRTPIFGVAVIPVPPNRGIVRKILTSDVAQRLEYPGAGRRIKRRIFRKIQQLRYCRTPLFFAQHS